jgi:flagellar biosynthesis/type III secretory pathway protein FliH
MDKIEFTIEEIATMVRAVFPEAMQDRAELAVYTAVRQTEAKAFDRGARTSAEYDRQALDAAYEDGYAQGYEEGYDYGSMEDY